MEMLMSSSSSAESSLEPDLTFPGMGGYRMVSLRGLIVFTICRKACIYNPATRQSLTLPTFKSNLFAQQEPYKHVHYFFGHDPVLDQYKIVCSVMIASSFSEMLFSEFWVFVLEPGGFWKRTEYDAQAHLPTRQGLCINGVIYYLAFNHTRRYHVYCFDVRYIRVIQAPHAVPQFCTSFGFIEHGGKPAIFDYSYSRITETGVSELWVLEVDGGIWSRKSLVLKLCQKHLVDDIDHNKKLIVHGTGENNEVILALTCPCYLLYYDLMKNDVRKVNINRVTTPHVSNPGLSTCEAPTVVRRLLALNTHMSLQIPASFRVRRESAVVEPAKTSAASKPQSIVDSYTASLEDMTAQGALDG
ncbi:LOW QUALITY PROTEIN: hypothetical protein HID58_039908 [Brassica napus]|uniref:F-box associated beta-propeller type 3 domain-containing protein n=1 Tax=Brassica napus TaxID=3708 RepID=A0ABQ7XFS3_BRANA|nr:LOW QUALITY PROTEIN: hypothetical protein HID58_039908 [Brassica napus]